MTGSVSPVSPVLAKLLAEARARPVSPLVLPPLQDPQLMQGAGALRATFAQMDVVSPLWPFWEGLPWICAQVATGGPHAAQTEWQGFYAETLLEAQAPAIAAALAAQGGSGSVGTAPTPRVGFGLPRSEIMIDGGRSGADGAVGAVDLEVKTTTKPWGTAPVLLNSQELIDRVIARAGYFGVLVFVLVAAYDPGFRDARLAIPEIAARRKVTARDRAGAKRSSRVLKSEVLVTELWALEIVNPRSLGSFQKGLANSNNRPRAAKYSLTPEALRSGDVRGQRLWTLSTSPLLVG